jgi:TRAP-type mannitol/chloroaromatic compound transport system permease small subunit
MAQPDAPGAQLDAPLSSRDHIPHLPETPFSRAVDPLIEWLGKVSSVFWPILVAVITVNVLMRYVLGRGLVEFEEIQWHLYAVGFLIAQAWCVQNDGHVRIDVFAEHFRTRTKCRVELFGILVWLLPFVLLVVWFSVPFVAYSLRIGEISEAPGGLPYRFAIKGFLFIGFVLLGIATVSRLTRVLAALSGRRGG